MNDSRLPRYTILAGVLVIGSSFAAFFLVLSDTRKTPSVFPVQERETL